MKLEIEYIPISEIKAYPNNAKIHTAEQIEQIKKSIQEFGFNDPIGIWHGECVEGHGRVIAATELGIDKVPVIRLDGLTDEQRRAYMLVHNKLTMNTDFDLDILKIELEDISNFDMSDFGFCDIETELDEKQKKLTEASYDERISVVIDCKNENDAERIFNELTGEGYTCRISTL